MEQLQLSAVAVSVDSGTGVLSLTRPETRNAMDADLLEDLLTALDWCTQPGRVRALIVTGAGGAFSVGGDLETLRRGVTDPAAVRCSPHHLAGELGKAVMMIYEMEFPVIAAIDGRAGGGGFSLALACDVRIASARVVFDFAYARLGATPDGGMTWLLPRIVGAARASELLIEAPIIRAPRALSEGIVQQIVPIKNLMPSSHAIADRMLRQPAHYVAAVKRFSRTAGQHGLERHLEDEQEMLTISLASEIGRRLLLGKSG